MSRNIFWYGGFIAAFVLHAIFFLSTKPDPLLAMGEPVAKWGSFITLASLLGLVVAYTVTRDEVQQRLMLRATAVSATCAFLLDYSQASLQLFPSIISEGLWSIALGIFLVTYGVQLWLTGR